MFVPSPQCIAIPYTLCIWIFPLWPPDSVSPGFILRFCRLVYSVSLCSILRFCLHIFSVSVCSYTLFLPALTLFLSPHLLGFPTLQPISLYGNAPFVLHLEKYHPSFALPLSPHPFRSPFPVSRCAPFFSVLPYLFHCALPSSFLPCSPLPHLVINRVLLPIPVLVGRLKAQ